MLLAKRPSAHSHTVFTGTAPNWTGSVLTGAPAYLSTIANFTVPTALPGEDETANTQVSIWNGLGGYNTGSGLIQSGIDISTSSTVAAYGSWREYCCGDPDSNGFGGAFVPNPGDQIFAQQWYCDAQGNANLLGGYGCSFLDDITAGAVLSCTSATGSPCWSVQALPLCSVSPGTPNCMTVGLAAEFIIEDQTPNAGPFTPLAGQFEMDGSAYSTATNSYSQTIGTDSAVTLLTDFTATTSHMLVSLGTDDQTYFNVSQWAQIPGSALSWLVPCPGKVNDCYPQSIAVGPSSNGSTIGGPWVLSSEQDESGNFSLFQLVNNTWVRRPGPGSLASTLFHTDAAAGRQLAISPQGYPWVVNQLGQSYYWNGSAFELAPGNGCATAIAVGPNAYGSKYGDPWIIGCDGADNVNGSIYQLQGSTWVKQVGSANRIAVSPQGVPWVVTAAGSIYRGAQLNLFGNQTLDWVLVPGCATSIAVGPNTAPLAGPYGDVWVTNCQPQGDAGHSIYQLQNGTSWVQIPGVASQISVSPDLGIPWVVNFGGQIFQ
jgi:hypothetical protein